MSEYLTRDDDTFAIVSRRVYGTEANEYLIRGANPGFIEPFGAGQRMIVPIDPDAPTNAKQQSPAADQNELAIFINGKRFRFWPSVSVTLSIDSVSTFSMTAPFEPTEESFRKSFVPFSFSGIEINIGGNPLFTGNIVNIEPTINEAGRSVSVNGYGRPGVLNDCTPPDDLAPLEYNNQGIWEIAQVLAKPFGVGIQIDADPGDVFDRVAAEPGKRVLTFLTELARQRGLLISDTPLGRLRFLKSIDEDFEEPIPVATLRQSELPLLSVSPEFDPQEYYSHITGVAPALFGGEGDTYTAKNPFVKNAVRPLTYSVNDVESGSLEQAVKSKLGRMFANMVSYTVQVPTWRDPKGRLWTPNSYVILNAPSAMVYDDYKFLIREVELTRDADSEVATLKLILPGSFSGQVAERLPWE